MPRHLEPHALQRVLSCHRDFLAVKHDDRGPYRPTFHLFELPNCLSYIALDV